MTPIHWALARWKPNSIRDLHEICLVEIVDIQGRFDASRGSCDETKKSTCEELKCNKFDTKRVRSLLSTVDFLRHKQPDTSPSIHVLIDVLD